MVFLVNDLLQKEQAKTDCPVLWVRWVRHLFLNKSFIRWDGFALLWTALMQCLRGQDALLHELHLHGLFPACRRMYSFLPLLELNCLWKHLQRSACWESHLSGKGTSLDCSLRWLCLWGSKTSPWHSSLCCRWSSSDEQRWSLHWVQRNSASAAGSWWCLHKSEKSMSTFSLLSKWKESCPVMCVNSLNFKRSLQILTMAVISVRLRISELTSEISEPMFAKFSQLPSDSSTRHLRQHRASEKPVLQFLFVDFTDPNNLHLIMQLHKKLK